MKNSTEKKMLIFNLKSDSTEKWSQVQRIKSVILASWEDDIKQITVQGQSEQKFMTAQLYQYLPWWHMSVIPSYVRKNK
jgi:hypothetical protein